MLHSDYSDYTIQLINHPAHVWLFPSKTYQATEECWSCTHVKDAAAQSSDFYFFYDDAAFQGHYERWRSCDCFGLSVCLLAELLKKSRADLHEQSEFMLSPTQSGWLFESAVVWMHKCLKLFFMIMSFKHKFANIVTNSDIPVHTGMHFMNGEVSDAFVLIFNRHFLLTADVYWF